jgi:putative transposase
MVTAPEYRHVPTGTLAVLAQRLGKVWASPSTWYRLVQKFGGLRPRNSVAVLVEASRGATPSETTPVVLADAGVENVNAQVDELITTGVLRRVLAFTELKFSNSMIEAWWRSLKHQWLFLHSLNSVTTVRRLVEFYVQEHNRVLPHSAFRGQTADEMYFGTGDTVPADLTSRGAAARRARVEAN